MSKYDSMESVSRHTLSAGGGLYIHVAFCRRKCIYCDFFSAGDRIADWHRYVDALCCELKFRKNELAYPLRTIYIGGGTPSLMPADEFIRLTEAIKPYMNDVEEFTIEVNPDDVLDEMLQVWRKGGVDRVSIGIQSLDDNVLSAIGRRHNASTARKAYSLVRKYCSNVSVDLIFGLPGQTYEMWLRDLKEIVAMRPEHVSAYSLMYEEGTALTALRDAGRVAETSEDLYERMFATLIVELKKAGYEHYETSNFALPGYRSKHNSSYWRQSPYLGIGPSAHSYDGFRIRKFNKADLRGYLDFWAPIDCECSNLSRSVDCIMGKECLNDEELREEYILTRMRTCEGIDLRDFKSRFGKKEYQKLISKCEEWIKDGSLIIDDYHLFLSEHAILFSDSVILDIA